MREKMTLQISSNLLPLKDEYLEKETLYESLLKVCIQMMSDWN